MCELYIEFSIPDIRELRSCYKQTEEFLLNELPDINWHSRLEIMNLFEYEYNIILKSLKISYLESIETNDEETREIIETYLKLLKIRYETKNYIDCILRHEIDGIVYLRNHHDKIVMPNKQPLPYSPNILECVKETNVPELQQKLARERKEWEQQHKGL